MESIRKLQEKKIHIYGNFINETKETEKKKKDQRKKPKTKQPETKLSENLIKCINPGKSPW